MPRMSAAAIKNSRGSQILQDKPREGTKLRGAFDALLTGEWVSLAKFGNKDGKLNALITQLETYELEIIARPNPEEPKGWSCKRHNQYKCVGIWEGAELKTLDEVKLALENSVLRDDKGLQDGTY